MNRLGGIRVSGAPTRCGWQFRIASGDILPRAPHLPWTPSEQIPARLCGRPGAAYGTGVAPPSAMRTILATALALVISASTVGIAMAESDKELAREQDRVEKHLLRVQQERFEAKARGEDSKTLKRLDREFKRTYGRRMDVIEERKALAD
jgi:hypothetical protein